MERLLRYRFRRITLWLMVCVALLSGLGLARTGHSIGMPWFVLGLVGLLVTVRKRTVWTLLFVVVCGLSFGGIRGVLFMRKLATYDPYYGHKVTIMAQASDDAVYGKHSQLTFAATEVVLSDGQKLAGKLQVSGFGLNAVYQGDTVRATGKLYPGFGAYQGSMSFAQLNVTSHHSSVVAEIRRKFVAGMQSALPEPLASFAMGLLIGQRATLPPNVKQDLLMVGLTHIIAVSGYNLTIMLGASKHLAGKRSKRISTLLSLALMGVFLLLAGSSASIVRAAIVSMLSIGAGYYGRSFKPLNLIVLAAAITAWASPFYIWSDTSWYLSFLAFFGVMVLAPLLAARSRHGWQNSMVLMVALESLCAETMTLPFVLHTFGQMSFAGLVANVLITTLVPLAMLLGLIAGLGGMFAGAIAGWLAWPARLVLTYMLDVAHMLANIPHVFIQNLGLSELQMVGMYGVTAILTFLLWKKTKMVRYATITDRKQREAQGA